jgi:hypothetical protein
MSKTFSLQDLESAAPRVLARLQGMAKLPAHGTVAGQAVASLFLEELGHDARGPVNDIDVFVNTNMPRSMRGLKEFPVGHQYQNSTKIQSTTTHHKDVTSVWDQYIHVKFIALRATLSILRTYQVGLINYTLIQSPGMSTGGIGHDADVSRAVVGGFDLNVVGVGINLTSGQVVASAGFLEFLNTSKLRVETCNTPAHTMVRLAKKFHGGDITGATCDFATERALLEVALACQAHGSGGGNGEYLSTVTRFGGGKYKALYDRFADVLPPIQEKKENLRDGTQYTFFEFCPQVLTDERDVELAQIASRKGVAALPSCVRQAIFVAEFPRIYDLFHPHRSDMDHIETAKRRAEFAAMDPSASEGSNLRCLQRALGKPVVNLQVPDMDEDDSAVFFYNQACAENAKRAQAAVDAWQSLRLIERQTLYNLSERADTALALYEDRRATWKLLLESHGEEVFDVVCRYREDDDAKEKAKLVSELLGGLAQMGPLGTKIVNKVLPCREDNDDISSTFKNIVELFPETEKSGVAARLMKWVVPGWPELSEETAGTRRRAVAYWVGAKQPVPGRFWEVLPADELPKCIEAICTVHRYRANSNQDLRDDFHDILGQCAHRLTPEQIGADGGRVLRAILCVGGIEALDIALGAAAAHPLIEQTLQNIIVGCRAKGRKNSFDVFGETEGDVDPWNDIKNPDIAIAGIERLCLQRSVGAINSAGRRAAPRL